MISGRRALFQIRVGEAGELLELERAEVSALVQMDAEIGAILMRAFILRRVQLVTSGVGDAVLLGSPHSAATLRAREFLNRNGHPYTYVDVERDRDAEVLLERFHVGVTDVPVLICRGERVLQESHQSGDCRVPRVQRCDRSRARARPGRRRRRPGRPRGRGLWRVGRARRARAGNRLARRTSRIELPHRKLSRLPHRHFGTGAGRRAPTPRRRSSARRC